VASSPLHRHRDRFAANREASEEIPADPVTATSSVVSLAALMTTETNRTDGAEFQASDIREFEFEPAINCAGGESAATACRFLRLAKFDNGAFERLNRYETALWRQAAQLLFMLNFLHRPLGQQRALPSRGKAHSCSLVDVEQCRAVLAN
jgi:hypothetical protein